MYFYQQVLEQVQKILDAVLHGPMTTAVLNAAQRDATEDTIYFDDFLGDGDLDLANKTKVSSCIWPGIR